MVVKTLMAIQQKKLKNGMRAGTRRLARWHMALAFVYGIQLITYDAGHLITPQIVLQRWIAVSILLVLSAITWLIARSQLAKPNTDRLLVWTLIITDILFASFNIYIQRGMASRGVILYIIPLCLATVLRSQSALITSAILSVAAYLSTTIAYFVLNFNEGYKLELYGEVGFYCGVILIIASMLWAVIRPRNNH